MAITKKRAKVSKNRKKNWNKHCDVTDVEEFLEEKRFEERIGGPVADKADHELFIVQNTVEEPVEYVKKRKIKKSLKCFQSIGSFSQVPPPVNVNGAKYSKKICAVKDKLLRASERKYKEIQSQPSKPKKVKSKSLFADDFRDLWNDEKEKKVDPEMKDLFEYHGEMMRTRTPKLPSHRKTKPSKLPSVEVPHPGASYNPSYQDHQALLQQALVVEEKKKKEELHLKRVLDDMFPTKDQAPTQESIMKEMSQGLFDEPETENEPEALYHLRNPPVSFEDRLTRSKKRKRKELKEQARLRTLEKLSRKRIHEFYRLKSIKKEIKHEAEVSQQKQEKRCKIKEEKMYQPRTLSKYKYEAPDIEIKLAEEMTGELRTLKAEGSLLEDRYKSLQRRNLIEPRVRQKHKRKYKLKRQIKRGHRDFK